MSKLGKDGQNGHLEFVLNENNAKIVYSACLLQLKDQKRELKRRRCREFGNGVFRVRRLDFSLESWEIQPSAVVGVRRKAALRGEAYAWAPDLRSFDKLQEVWVSPYLGFTIYLSVL